ncbi:MAG: ribosome maturation factor RimP [Actinomycetales bacterium]|nr:ribosome maturation factor RimP [Actinomycetales bacterium]
MANVAELTAHLSPIVSALGYEVDDIELTTAGRRRVLEVILDADQPVDLTAISMATRAISNYLDESNLMGEMPYLLEVSSRGVSRPLTKAVHWRRNIDRLVEIKGSAHNLTGRITAFEDPIVTITSTDSKNKSTVTEVDINSISKATIQVEFKKFDESEED